MGILDETRFIERQQFFNGQRLFASDLQGLEAFNREMRWLHNRSLHQPGIGNGLAVYGQKGDRQVSIGPGYAIDSLGREIVLTEMQLEPVPPVAGEDNGTPVFYDLTVAYPDDVELEVAETRDGVCLPRGVVRLREMPILCWVRLKQDDLGNLRPQSLKLTKDIQDGLKIILARIEVLNCQLNQPVSIAQRREARPGRLPYIGCGVAEPTPWRDLQLGGASSAIPTAVFAASIPGLFALTADIDTTTAGFLTTPCFSAHIPGPRIMTVSVPQEGTLSPVTVLVVDQMYVQDAQPDRFSVSLLGLVLPLPFSQSSPNTPSNHPETPEASVADTSMNATSNPDPITEKVIASIKTTWNVVWMGVEG
jgi:hypothetical protein